MDMKTRIAVISVITLWASAFVGIKAGLQTFSPEGLSLTRYLIASIVIGVFYFLTQRKSKVTNRDKIALLLTGVISIGCYNLMLGYGELSVSSGMAGFIASQNPVLTTMFAVMFLGETLTPLRITGFVVSIFGVTLIAAGEAGVVAFNVGILYMLLALLAGSVHSVLQKPFMQRYNALEATTYIIWGGTLFLMIYASHLKVDLANATWFTLLDVVYLGVFPAVVAYVAWGYILSKIPVSRASSFVYAMPFIAAFLGWALLGEVPAMTSMLGALLAIFGVWLISQSYRKQELVAEPA